MTRTRIAAWAALAVLAAVALTERVMWLPVFGLAVGLLLVAAEVRRIRHVRRHGHKDMMIGWIACELPPDTDDRLAAAEKGRAA